MARFNRLILPVGLPLAVLVGLLLPELGRTAGSLGAGPLTFSDIAIIVIFFINGLQTRLAGVKDRHLVRAALLVLGINLLLAPLVGAAAVWLLSLPLGLATGVALMVSVPTTLSSAAVIAVSVGGDRAWALTLTIVTVLLGSVTAPLAVSGILAADVSVSPWPILADVLWLVLAPTVLGYGLRKLWWSDPPQWLGAVPSVAVLSVVWVTMSTNAETALQMPWYLVFAMVLAAAVGHGVLLAAAGAVVHGMPVQHAMPVLFVASQKTLPLALTILTIISEQVPQIAGVAAIATITCVVWHFLQLFVDSLLAQRLAVRYATAT